MRISRSIALVPLSRLRPYPFTTLRLPLHTSAEAARLRQSLTEFPPDVTCLAIQAVRDGLDGLVVIGQQRVALAGALGIQTLPVQWIEETNPTELERWAAHENQGRRTLTVGQRIQLALTLKPSLAAEAKARRGAGLLQYHSRRTAPHGLPVREQRTDAKLAEIAQVSPTRFRTGEKILTRGDPPLVQAYLAGKISTRRAALQLPPQDRKPKRPTPPALRWTAPQTLQELTRMTAAVSDEWTKASARWTPPERAHVRWRLAGLVAAGQLLSDRLADTGVPHASQPAAGA